MLVDGLLIEPRFREVYQRAVSQEQSAAISLC